MIKVTIGVLIFFMPMNGMLKATLGSFYMLIMPLLKH